MKEEKKTILIDNQERIGELKGLGGMFYGMGWIEVLLILGNIFPPILILLLLI